MHKALTPSPSPWIPSLRSAGEGNLVRAGGLCLSERRFNAVLALLLLCALAGCSKPETDTNPPANSAPATTNSQSAAKVSTPAETTYITGDSWTIVGDKYAPSGKPAGKVILLHQRGGSAKDWQPLCIALQQAGITAIALDLRGTGRSTHGTGPTGDNAPWQVGGDIAGVIAKETFGPFALVGASYGANNALIYAAENPGQVKGVVLFSPGENYNGLDALAPARTYSGPLLIFHDKGDDIAKDGPQQIKTASPSKDATLTLLDGSDHGTALLNSDTIQATVAFLQRALK